MEIWLKQFPDIAQKADLDPVDAPLLVSPDDLSEVVQALANQRELVTGVLDDPPAPRISYEQKNTLNNMSADYAKSLRKRYLKDTGQIRQFLATPDNAKLLDLYESTVDEFQLKIWTAPLT